MVTSVGACTFVESSGASHRRNSILWLDFNETGFDFVPVPRPMRVALGEMRP
jgi:hypothetical protein